MFVKSISTKGGDVLRDEFSVAFDGTDDYLTMGDITLVDGLDDLTITCWIKPKTANRNPIISKGNYNDSAATFNFTYNLDSGTDSGAGRLMFSVGNSVFAYKSSLGAETDKWHHMAVTYSNTDDEIFFYLNGTKISPTAESGTFISLANTSKELKIGADDSYYAEGNISEVTIYNKVLTSNQIKTIYNGREPYNHKEGVASGNLQAWYRMGDGALDSKGADKVIDWNGIIADEVTSKIGNELVANKTFSGSSNWTLGTGWAIGLTGLVGTDYSGDATQSLAAEVDKIYQLSVNLTDVGDLTDITLISFGGYIFYIVQGGADIDAGLAKGYMVAANTNDLKFSKFGHGTPNITVKSISIKEITGNAGVMLNMSSASIKGDTP